jgi:hypothetical protein
MRRNLPGTFTQNVKTQQTSGNTALIQETRTVKASGSTVGTLVSHYAVDRQTLMATRNHPSGWKVTPASGITVSWPLGAKKQNYTGWVIYTESTTSLKYVNQTQQGGISTYQYHATVPPTQIKNPQVLAALPQSLPVSPLGSSRRPRSPTCHGSSPARHRSRSATPTRPVTPTSCRRPPDWS